MSAEERRHEDAPKKIDEWGISEERLSSIRTLESEGSSALAHEWVPVDCPPGIPSDAALDSDDTLDRLFSAIGDTEVARRLRGLTPADGSQTHAPARAEPPATPIHAVEAKAEPFAATVQAAPLRAEPPKTSLAAAEVKVEPPAAVAQAAPAAHAVGTFIVQASASAPLMPPATAPHPRVSAKPGMNEAAAWAAVPRAPSPPKPVDEAGAARVAAAESAPAVTAPRQAAPARDRSPETATPVPRGSERERLGAKLAPIAKSMGRAFWRSSVQFTNRVVAEAEAILESTDFAESRRSTGLDDSAHATQKAPVTEDAGHPAPQPSTRLRRWLDPRRGLRLAKPPAVAYCWTADTPDPVEIADIGPGGVRLLTDARWPCGGVFSMTLQRTDRTSETPESWIVVDFMVVRLCSDGVAGAFIPSTHGLSRVIPSRAENCADEKTLKHFVRNLSVAGGV